MKTNGIIRKVDGLGRVVIPREYRKLHKISLGDPMEISCLDNGEIVLKKMDMTLSLEELSWHALRTIGESVKGTVLLSNRNKWIGGNGDDKGIFIGKQLPSEIKRKIDNREEYSVFDARRVGEFGALLKDKTVLLGEPIAGDADVFGALFLACKNEILPMEITLIKTTAEILGNSLQKF